jgi:ABC-2 type transport system permease protein
VSTHAGAGFREAGVLRLLAPKWTTQRRRLSQGASVARTALLVLVAAVFWLVLFALMYRMLRYFQGSGVGDVLALKLLSLLLLAFLSILLLSNIITALSSFFLSRDLELIASAPVDAVRVYGARLIETLIQASWMMVIVLAPVITAYGAIYDGGLLYLVNAAVAMVAFLVLPSVVGAALTLVLVNVFPARRARDLLALVALLGAGALIAFVRLLRPEQLASPEGFRDLVDFIQVLQTPQSVWLPSDWAAQAILAPLGVLPRGTDLFPLLLLVTTAAAFVVLGAMLHVRLYNEGLSRAQEGASQTPEAHGPRRALLERTLGALPVTARSLVAKDIRAFFRDTTQWSQLILLVVLVVVYIYNIRVLPLYSGEQVGFFLTNVISFLNLGLAGFVLAAIAARFIFPAVSLEGRTLWLLRSAPLDLRTLLWSKYWVGVLPLLLLALALTFGTNLILRVDTFMMVLSLATITLVTFGVASLALGLGAIFPKFDTDNAAEVSTGFGGLVFMMVAVAFLGVMVMLEAWPVYTVLRARALGRPITSGMYTALATGLGAALLLALAVIIVPLRIARARVQQLDR